MKKVVIVTGAGSSCELGVDGGISLLMRIADDIGDSARFNSEALDLINQFLSREKSKRLNNLPDIVRRKIYFENILRFKDPLVNWGKNGNSIDSFLRNETNAPFREFGQFAISYFMIGAEDWLMRQNLYGIKSNWLKNFLELHLENNMSRIISGELELQLITFNYERILEHFIYNFVRHKMQNPLKGLENGNDQANDFITRLNIQHIYGKIADLEWQNSAEKKHVRFGERNDNMLYTSLAMGNIRLIGEPLGRIDEDKISCIRKSVQSADKVYLLGFGYDESNLNILFGDISNLSKPSKQKIVSTVWGDKEFIYDLTKRYASIAFHERRCSEFVGDKAVFNLD
ncbi:MAG: hypothetical protein HY064_11370 [Bacteroidetes bacterium]|nr:hypothetical protein [Bacteroidota bacterium]